VYSVMAAEFGGEGTEALLASASLVVAMHPDEATEAVVTEAVKHGVPFAVVPCCVFARLFSHRTLGEGSRVSTHGQLCTWLAERHPKAQMASLDFKGKNTVVYWLGDGTRVRFSPTSQTMPLLDCIPP
jgi:hypothetical protein